MPDSRDYRATEMETLFASHDVATFTAQEKFALAKAAHAKVAVAKIGERKSSRSEIDRTIVVPFSGPDGQALAGSGALVWEGEILEKSE